ncbi:MAG: DUF2726 domain-containing protein [Ectothiorhodospiraceae bacterium]|nr:DUF2726 domain-containing protein [Ectothiorhodospiraceae bacterium]
MEPAYLIAGAVVLGLLALFLLVRRRRGAGGRRGRLRVRLRPVLDQSGLSWYRLLQRALPAYLVLPGVSFSAFLQPPETASGRDAAGEEGLRAHTADFLICDPQARPVAVVMLGDDSSAAVADLLREAAIPLLRYRRETLAGEQEIRDTLHDLESLGRLASHLTGDEVAVDPPERPGPVSGGRERKEPRL